MRQLERLSCSLREAHDTREPKTTAIAKGIPAARRQSNGKIHLKNFRMVFVSRDIHSISRLLNCFLNSKPTPICSLACGALVLPHFSERFPCTERGERESPRGAAGTDRFLRRASPEAARAPKNPVAPPNAHPPRSRDTAPHQRREAKEPGKPAWEAPQPLPRRGAMDTSFAPPEATRIL